MIFLTREILTFLALNWLFLYFYLVTILIMAMFNFQFWVGIKIGSWYYLTCYTSLTNQVELHVFQLILILFYLPSQIWYCIQFVILLIKLDRIFIFFLAYIIIFYTPSKNPDCKIEIFAKKNFILRHFINIFFKFFFINRECFQ